MAPRPAPGLILITGAAGAIGAALARALSSHHAGAHLALTDVDGDGLARVAAPLGARASTWQWDLSRPADLEAAHAALVAAHGPVDLLVNCAGIMDVRTLAATPWALGQRILDVDLISPMRLMNLTAPAMVARGAGAIVNVSSMAGRVPLRGCAFYGGSKAGLAMASENVHLELAGSGVHVVTVYPGPVESALERNAKAQVPTSRLARLIPTGDPDRLAQLVVRALDRGEPRVVYPPAYALADRAIGLATWFTRRFSPQPLA
ncbi:MAG: SDR family NAD(P)-dependent oxidoreductase [Kofleriaceae bacterium]|nr:SDR family NAD(P)-dependent oxidoreductase [Myxococcales bacterium]MCB9563846.1 SDR family NAD(P)-dependent oxidoreductase [Kofleriaceae bacterium]